MGGTDFAQGGSCLSPIGQVLGYVGRVVGDFEPSKSSEGGRLSGVQSAGQDRPFG